MSHWIYNTANGRCRGTLRQSMELPGDYAPTYKFTRTDIQINGEWKPVGSPQTDMVCGIHVEGKTNA